MTDEKAKELQAILDGMPDSVYIRGVSEERDPEKDLDPHYRIEAPPERACISISFSIRGFGFGEVAIHQDAEGQVYLDTEYMGRDKVAKVLGMLLENAITEYDNDPARHTKYNAFTGRQCGEHCQICYPSGTPGTPRD